jgi:hypothetical protein
MTEIPINYKHHSIYTRYFCEPTTGIIINHLNKEIKTWQEHNGYLHINIRYNGKSKTYSHHRFVYECVNGLIPKDKEIDHIDNNRTNNKISNLQLVTHQENLKKSAKNRDYTFVKHNHKNKHLIKAEAIDGSEIIYYDSMYSCQELLKVNAGIIKYCCEGKNHVKSGKSKLNNKSYKFNYVDEIPENIKVQKIQNRKAMFNDRVFCPVCERYLMKCRIKHHNESIAHMNKLKIKVEK